MFADQDMLESLAASLQVGAVVAIAVDDPRAVGREGGHALSHAGTGRVTGLIMLPLFIPEIILGISLLILINAIDIPLSLITVAIGHVMLCTPFAMAVLTSRLDGFDRSLEEASMDLGRNAVDDVLARDVSAGRCPASSRACF